jgi:hypothetical protein
MTMPIDKAEQADPDPSEQLFVAGEIELAGPGANRVDIRRGMPILCADGEEVGQVAAVVCNADCRAVTHILLSRWCGSLDYRLIPVGRVRSVHDGVVALEMTRSALDSLPTRAPA